MLFDSQLAAFSESPARLIPRISKLNFARIRSSYIIETLIIETRCFDILSLDVQSREAKRREAFLLSVTRQRKIFVSSSCRIARDSKAKRTIPVRDEKQILLIESSSTSGYKWMPAKNALFFGKLAVRSKSTFALVRLT